MKQPTTGIARLVPLTTAVLLLAGCFYPPPRKPSAHKDFQLVLGLPYDLAWQAVHQVIADNRYRITAENPDQGIIEVEDGGFKLKDADCGKVAGIIGKVAAEPGAVPTAVYNFQVVPNGPEASLVGIQATFRAPIHVPLHPMRSVMCVSSGRQERRLLKQLQTVAATIHRPAFKRPAAADSSAPVAAGPDT